MKRERGVVIHRERWRHSPAHGTSRARPPRGAPPSIRARRVPVFVEEEHGFVDIFRPQPGVHPEQRLLELARLHLVRVGERVGPWIRARVTRGNLDSGDGLGVGSRFELAGIDVAAIVFIEAREDGERDLNGA